MTTTTTTYRKTKTGEWVVFGPANLIHEGGDVLVTKRDGTTKTEHIERVGKTFAVDGINARYGYIGRAPHSHNHSRSRSDRGECVECGAYGPLGLRCHECYEGTFC